MNVIKNNGPESSKELTPEELEQQKKAQEIAEVKGEINADKKDLTTEVVEGKLSDQANKIANTETHIPPNTAAKAIAAANAVAANSVAPNLAITTDPESLKTTLDESEKAFKNARKAIHTMKSTEKNDDTLYSEKNKVGDILSAFEADGIVIDNTDDVANLTITVPDLGDELSSKEIGKIKDVIRDTVLLQTEIDKRIEANELLETAKRAVIAYEASPKDESLREAAHTALTEMTIISDDISKYQYSDGKSVSIKSVPSCQDLRTKFQACLEKYGYTDITVQNKKGKNENIGTQGKVEASQYNGASFEQGVAKLNESVEGELTNEMIMTIQSALVGTTGDLAYPTTMQQMTTTRGAAGAKYAKKYQKLYYNHHMGLSKKSEAQFQGHMAKIIEGSGDASFGTIREMKKYYKRLSRLAKKDKRKLKYARKALGCAVERAYSRHQLRRSMDITDHLMQIEGRGPEHHHGLPAYDAGGMRETSHGKDVIMFAHSTFGENRMAEIQEILGDKKFSKLNLTMHVPHGTLTPTRGIESYLAEEARTDKKSTKDIEDGRMHLYPGSPAEALSWYLQKFNSRDLEGGESKIISVRWATFMVERWFKTGAEGYDIIGALQASGMSKEEAQGVSHQILKDAFRGNGGWRTKMRYHYSQLSDNYRANKQKLNPSKDYSGKGINDIKELDKHRLRGMAAVRATAGVFCNNENEKAMAQRRLSQVWENGTEARNPVEGISGGLGNEIVGEQMLRMLHDIDGKGAGDWKDRYLGGLSSDGYFAGGLNSVEHIFNNLAKDALGLDASAAHKVGKVAKFAAAGGLIYGGFKLLKWAWKGRPGDSPSFRSRAGRIGVLAGTGFLLGDEIKAGIWGGQFGKSGIGKKIMSVFGMESAYEASEGLSPVQTLGFVFGGMSTATVLSMFTANKNGNFELSKDALKNMKQANPNMDPAHLESISTILKDPDSDINVFLTTGLANLGINKDSIGKVKANFGGTNFNDYINSYVAATKVTGALSDAGFTEQELSEYKDALVSASPEEKEILTDRINKMKQYEAYYPKLRATLTHILEYRPDMLAASKVAGSEADLLAGLANTTDFASLRTEYIMAVSGATANGFDKESKFEDFLKTVNKNLYKDNAEMAGFLDQTQGMANLQKEFNTPTVEAFSSPYNAPGRYLNRAAGTGEGYKERLITVDGKQVFMGIEEGTEEIKVTKEVNGKKTEVGTGELKSRLVLRVPDGANKWKQIKIAQQNEKDFFIRSLGRDDTSGKFEMDVFGQTKPSTGGTVNKYVKREIFTSNFIKDIVNAASSKEGSGSVTFGKNNIVGTAKQNLKVNDEFKIDYIDTGKTRP